MCCEGDVAVAIFLLFSCARVFILGGVIELRDSCVALGPSVDFKNDVFFSSLRNKGPDGRELPLVFEIVVECSFSYGGRELFLDSLAYAWLSANFYLS